MPAKNLLIKTQYWDDPKARKAFKAFMIKIHGLDFSEWESSENWDYAYTPFSFFDGEKVVSNVCVYSLDAIIDGERTSLAQISGVGTLPEWRRMGLNRRLNEAGMAWARERHAGIFLFANIDAIPFYKACGFTPMEEYVEFVEAKTVHKIDGAIKLNPARKEDLEKIQRYATRRAPISDKFSILNEKLIMFHALYALRNHIYEIPDLNCLIFIDRDKGCLRIFDIIGENIPPLDVFYPYVADKDDTIIEFHFHADKLGCDGVKTIPLYGNHPFIKGEFPVKNPVFPYTSRA